MNNEYNYNFNDKIPYRGRINFFIFIILTFTPLIIFKNPISFTYFPKVVFFCICFLIIAILYFLKIEKPIQIHRYEDKLLLIYIGLIVLSTLSSPQFLNSVFGYVRRYEGLLMLLIYIFLFYISSNNFSFNKKHFSSFVLVYSLISIFGILNYYGVLPAVREAGLVYNNGRAISFFGNPNFFGSYLTLLLPVSVFTYIKSGKLSYLITSGIVYLALITTFTRSGWLGSMIGFMVVLFYTVRYKYSKKNIIIILAILISITIVMDLQSDGRVLSRFTSIQKDAKKVITQAEDYENAGASRMFIWIRVIELIKEKPLLGHGFETMGDVFSERYMDEVLEFSGRRIIFDKAHNEYLHIAYSTGIPSLIVYLLFVFTILIRGFKVVKYNHMAIPVLASIVGYLIQGFFNISVISVAYIFWIFLGILLKISLYPDDVGLQVDVGTGALSVILALN